MRAATLALTLVVAHASPALSGVVVVGGLARLLVAPARPRATAHLRLLLLLLLLLLRLSGLCPAAWATGPKRAPAVSAEISVGEGPPLTAWASDETGLGGHVEGGTTFAVLKEVPGATMGTGRRRALRGGLQPLAHPTSGRCRAREAPSPLVQTYGPLVFPCQTRAVRQ